MYTTPEKKSFVCVICGKEIINEFGNNAEPVKIGRCCDECNKNTVMPSRLKAILREKNKD